MTKREHAQRAMAFLRDALRLLDDAGAAIDSAGEHASVAVGNDGPDMLSCFASNTLHGTRALLRELRAALREQGKGRRRGA